MRKLALVAFAVENGKFQPWLERLAEHGIEVEASVDWPGGGLSVYFRDPAGNSIELATPHLGYRAGPLSARA
jgi:catechol 2,3-dioxygenase-like lactoylglutathione lyase family enzyme